MKYWFRAKRYGYGWVPCTWQGWLVVVVYIVLMTLNAFRLEHKFGESNEAIPHIIIQALIMTTILIYISYKKACPPSR